MDHMTSSGVDDLFFDQQQQSCAKNWRGDIGLKSLSVHGPRFQFPVKQGPEEMIGNLLQSMGPPKMIGED